MNFLFFVRLFNFYFICIECKRTSYTCFYAFLKKNKITLNHNLFSTLNHEFYVTNR